MEFHFKKYLVEAWELFKKAPEVFIVVTVVFGAASILVGFMPGFGKILSAVVNMLLPPALFLCADDISTTGKSSFRGLNRLTEFLPQIFILNLVQCIFLWIGLILLVIPFFYLAVSYIFSSQYVLFRGKTFWDAMEASRKLVGRNWFEAAFFSFLLMLLALSGLLFLGIGILVTGPLATIVIYYAFKDISSQPEIVEPISS